MWYPGVSCPSPVCNPVGVFDHPPTTFPPHTKSSLSLMTSVLACPYYPCLLAQRSFKRQPGAFLPEITCWCPLHPFQTTHMYLNFAHSPSGFSHGTLSDYPSTSAQLSRSSLVPHIVPWPSLASIFVLVEESKQIHTYHPAHNSSPDGLKTST